MGCVCGKASSAIKDSEESPKQRELIKKTSELQAARAISSKRNESFTLKEKLKSGDVQIALNDKKVGGSRRVRDDDCEKKKETSEAENNVPGVVSFIKAAEGEQMAAGWPSWLVTVAGEAIRGWIPRKADSFEKLDKIGQGTYSSVYKGRDLLHNKVVALKRVRFDSMDPESVRFMAREIIVLRRLDHPNIIKLEGLITSRSSSSIYLVFEYMEHDLTGIASLPGVKFTEAEVKCYMQQLLSGLDYCHTHGILHRDIKGSNLLIDNHGVLKIADFGLASYFNNHRSIQLTSRVVTLWYRPPELLLGATEYGAAVDLWSSGCILGELYTGKPIMAGRTEVEQLHKIFKLCGSPSDDYWNKSRLPHSTDFKPIQPYRRRIGETYKDLPDAAVGLIDILLSFDPSARGTAASALKNEFFTTKPLACDPSSMPKYPPSKEIDAKLREAEARRKRDGGVRGQRGKNSSRNSQELWAAPAPGAKAECARSMQRRQGHPEPKSRSELFNPQKDKATSGVLIGNDLSPSYSRASRALSSIESRKKLVPSQVESTSQVGRVSESFGVPMKKHDRELHSQNFSGSHQIENGRASTKEPVVDGNGCKERKIHFSGPILSPSNNIEQVLKEHDRLIKEVARRLNQEKTRSCRVRPHETLF